MFFLDDNDDELTRRHDSFLSSSSETDDEERQQRSGSIAAAVAMRRAKQQRFKEASIGATRFEGTYNFFQIIILLFVHSNVLVFCLRIINWLYNINFLSIVHHVTRITCFHYN